MSEENQKLKELIKTQYLDTEEESNPSVVNVFESAETNYRIEIATNGLLHMEKLFELLKKRRYKVFFMELDGGSGVHMTGKVHKVGLHCKHCGHVIFRFEFTYNGGNKGVAYHHKRHVPTCNTPEPELDGKKHE
jgi:hypothetical protein